MARSALAGLLESRELQIFDRPRSYMNGIDCCVGHTPVHVLNAFPEVRHTVQVLMPIFRQRLARQSEGLTPAQIQEAVHGVVIEADVGANGSMDWEVIISQSAVDVAVMRTLGHLKTKRFTECRLQAHTAGNECSKPLNCPPRARTLGHRYIALRAN